jgi:hypothetical protein
MREPFLYIRPPSSFFCFPSLFVNYRHVALLPWLTPLPPLLPPPLSLPSRPPPPPPPPPPTPPPTTTTTTTGQRWRQRGREQQRQRHRGLVGGGHAKWCSLSKSNTNRQNQRNGRKAAAATGARSSRSREAVGTCEACSGSRERDGDVVGDYYVCGFPLCFYE